MQYTAVVKLIMDKGTDNVQVPSAISFQSFTEAGRLLSKENRHEEAGKAFAKINNQQELLETGNWFWQQGRAKEASYYYRFINDIKKIEACAIECMNQDHYEEAKALLESTGNYRMLSFLKTNFNL
tara:strand:- start:11307 stop:11684 length:378 start_codon:yes stop_codon:yes gene_type:complete